ncbi:hypothetical protein CRYUN_Cryun03dG0136400 [Craigia yunnanensis]
MMTDVPLSPSSPSFSVTDWMARRRLTIVNPIAYAFLSPSRLKGEEKKEKERIVTNNRIVQVILADTNLPLIAILDFLSCVNMNLEILSSPPPKPSLSKPAAPPEVMTSKDCGHHDDKQQLVKRILIAIFGLLIVFAIVVFLVWAILHPAKPRFILQDVTIYTMNFTAPNYLSSNIQITLASRNPNDRIGIYYQKLDIFASYRNQQITLPTLLPRTYQGHHDVTIWSPILYGNDVPVAPFLEVGLNQDMNAGLVLLNIMVFGQLKWKVATWISGQYQIYANCPAFISFSDGTKNIQVGPAMKYQLLQTCSVDVSLN